MIPFNVPPVTGEEEQYVLQALHSKNMCGDGFFGKECQKWFEKSLPCKKALMTPSCTAALELSALLLNIQPGDEVIMPSYTFVSTANAFVLRGGRIVFVDIRPDTMNIDENLIEAAITPHTKAIVPVHYAGVACNMDIIMEVAERHNLYVIEDAAQAMMSQYKGKALGTIGHFGAFSFHETKNYTSGGEGGLLIINDEKLVDRAEIIREKGTDRSQFFRGMVDKYQWVDMGSSYLPSELQAAYLWGQLLVANDINNDRLQSWNTYYRRLSPLELKGLIELPKVPPECAHNAHMFFIKVDGVDKRAWLIEELKNSGIMSAFHYVPLHSSEFGALNTVFFGTDKFTSVESEKLLRLPLWFGIEETSINVVCDLLVEIIT